MEPVDPAGDAVVEYNPLIFSLQTLFLLIWIFGSKKRF